MIAKLYDKNIARYGVVSENAPMLCFLGIGHLRRAFIFLKIKNMIAKISLDGKDHLAVVFNETISYEDLQGIKNALLSCLTNALMKECYMTEDDKFYFLSLVQDLELKEQQALSMFKKYFNDNVEKQGMPIKKTCDIYV